MSAPHRRPRVAIVFRYVHHYRRPFYELLRDELTRRGVDLQLVYGQPGPHEAARRDAVEVPWGVRIENRYLALGSKDLCWQPCLRTVHQADLVVVEQASRLLVTYALLADRLTGGPRLAFWGHGHNLQLHRASRIGERVKGAVTRGTDWFFAYNELSAEAARRVGVHADRITVVQNAVDTGELQALRDATDDAARAAIRDELGLKGDAVGVFTGTLYDEKRLPFLIAAADLVRRSLPDFELLVIGTGPAEAALQEAALSRPWVHPLGPLYGAEKARAMLAAKALLLPGAVGLAILDGFALDLPLVTTRVPGQGQEIDYLQDGVNGVLVEAWRDPEAYADAVLELFGDDGRLARLRRACREAASKYTVQAMARNFADGVERALEVPRAR